MLLLLLACHAPADLERPDPGALHAEGPRLVDEHGRTVTLRGVNAGGRSKFAPYLPFEDEDVEAGLDRYLDRAASWGIDVLRVPFSWEAMEPVEGQDDEAWLARYDALLDGAAARGMWTIVDFHQDIYAEVYCGDGFPAWTVEDPPAPHHDCPDWFLAYLSGDAEVDAAFDAFWADSTGVRSAFDAMWARMVARHADRPGVIGYELLNEPHRGSATEAEWAEAVYRPFVEQAAARLQAQDPGALVFFDATGLDAIDQEPAFSRPAGEDLVFAPHFYDPTAFVGGDPDPDLVAAGLGRWADLGEAWDLPVLVGEVGVDNDAEAAGDYAAVVWDTLAARGLGGTWWEYSVASESWNEEDMSLVEADGTEVEALVAELARPYPALLAGEGATTTRDGAAWVIEWTPTEGITELRWPSRLGEPTVEVEGAVAEVEEGVVLVQAEAGATRVRVRLTGSGA